MDGRTCLVEDGSSLGRVYRGYDTEAFGFRGLGGRREIDYIEKAVAYAEDLDALAQLRAGLRQRVDASKLSAGEVLTLNLESTYQQMIEKIEESSL